LDYTLYGPLQKLRTYSDSTLKVLYGRCFEYDVDGRLIYYGQYVDNKKDGYWSYLNDTGKVFKTERYQMGELVDADVKDSAKKDISSYPDEKEASFKKSVRDWTKYIEKNLDPDVGAKSVKGGRVMLRFVVNTIGEIENIFLEKSVEFVLDEAAIKVIRDSPLWTPAFQNGKNVRAYRRQPLTFLK
jgi:periplasmic protein TonB